MRGRPTTQEIRLRLLALVLALALTWYAMNPAPGPARRAVRDDEPPDEKRREADSSRGVGYRLARAGCDAPRAAPTPARSEVQEIDDLEWPDVIDLK